MEKFVFYYFIFTKQKFNENVFKKKLPIVGAMDETLCVLNKK